MPTFNVTANRNVTGKIDAWYKSNTYQETGKTPNFEMALNTIKKIKKPIKLP